MRVALNWLHLGRIIPVDQISSQLGEYLDHFDRSATSDMAVTKTNDMGIEVISEVQIAHQKSKLFVFESSLPPSKGGIGRERADKYRLRWISNPRCERNPPHDIMSRPSHRFISTRRIYRSSTSNQQTIDDLNQLPYTSTVPV
jgi:hypothetical protein